MPEEEGYRTLIEVYMESAKGLRLEEQEIILRMNDSVMRLYEVLNRMLGKVAS